MSEKLRDYQVLDVLCGGTFYKVRHKVTNNIFTWKAYNCSAYTDGQIQHVVDDVKTISKVRAENLLKYHDTILHAPSRTLYFVVDHNSWRSLEDLVAASRESGKCVAESFVWYLLHELARVCKELEGIHLLALQTCITLSSVYVDESGELRVDCFNLPAATAATVPSALKQAGSALAALCQACSHPHLVYSDDLRDVLALLTDARELGPDALLYHPTVLANLETTMGPKNLSKILVSTEYSSDSNKCDSEKAVELCKAVEPAPRSSVGDSPVYCNINPRKAIRASDDSRLERGSLSPTIAALALELPGFVPRSRRPLTQALQLYNSPQKVTEKTLSHQWMTRLIALRQREQSLNMRERELISKEIVNSPAAKVVTLNESPGFECALDSNGITLPALISQLKGEQRNGWVPRRRRRSSSARSRTKNRKSYNHEDRDSSLSADTGDSIIVTATKFTKENMPRRNIFPEIATKKVHFTAANPFVESDDSVTLTFYELDNVDTEGYQVPRKEDKVLNDITKFKYLDLEKATSEKRAAMKQWSHSSPSKQPKITKQVFSDITNTNLPALKRTPSKSSIASKMSSISSGTQCSSSSSRSQWSMESAKSQFSKVSDSISDRTRASMRQSLAPCTPAPEIKKTKSRKSLLPFKTPFKFMSSK